MTEMNGKSSESSESSTRAPAETAALSRRGQGAAAEPLSYGEKLRITNGDAVRTVAALAVVVVVWLACGFGLAGFDVQLFHLPLWVVAGLLGTWAAAIVAAVVLARSFKDFDLEDERAAAGPPAGAGSGSAGGQGAASDAGSADGQLAAQEEGHE